MTHWTLTLLGDCQLVARDGTAVRLATRKAALLLAYLAMQPRRGASRQRLADLLWEESDPAQGRLHVRKALWLIRSAAEQAQPDAPSPIETEGDVVSLSAAVEVDAAAFLGRLEQASGSEQLAAACSLYRGEFLGDHGGKLAPAFATWADGQREVLRGKAVAAYLQLAERLREEGRLAEAEQAALSALAIDPLQEPAHRLLMLALAEQGRTAAAIQQYRELRALLQRELDVTPEPATDELHQRLLQGRSEPVATSLMVQRSVATSPMPVRTAPRRGMRWALGGAAAALLLGSAAALQLSSAQAQSVPEIRRIFPVVTGLPGVGEPALSPDGSRVVFAARAEDGEQKLFVLTIGDRAPLPLTTGPGADDNPAWSPDGTTIAFTRSDPLATRARIIVKTVPNGAERVVGSVTNSDAVTLAWALDGGALFTADATDPGGTTGIVRIGLRDGQVTRLTRPEGSGPGDRMAVPVGPASLVFLRSVSRDTSEIVRLNLGSGKETMLTQDKAAIGGLAPGPQEGELLFSSDRGGDAGLWSVSLQGGEPRRVSEGLLRYRELSSSASGHRLLFEGIRDRSGLSWLVRGGKPTPAAESDFRDWYPAVARDGTLAFVSTRSSGQQIWMREPGGEATQLTRLPRSQIADVRWSPDGTRLGFVASGAHGTDLFLAATNGSAPMRLTFDGTEKRSPAWAPDGRSLYYIKRDAGETRVWQVVPGLAGTARPVSGPGPADIRIDPAGRWLYFVIEGRPGIFRQPLADGRTAGPLELVLRTRSLPPFSWEVGEGAVYLADGDDLRRVEIASDRSVRLTDARSLNRRSPFTLKPGGGVLLNPQTLKVELYGSDF